MGSGADRTHRRSIPLPWPASALRERLRTLAIAVTDTRVKVMEGRAEAAARFDRVDAALAHLAQGHAGAATASAPDGPPEWEHAAEGWEVARRAEHERAGGWSVRAVAEAYEAKWPSFLRAIEGTGPLGVAHEVLSGNDVGRDDPLAQNTVLAFAYALQRTALLRRDGGERPLSVLDWGGALGHYRELAARLAPEIELDYHVKELPEVCAAGRRVAQEVVFHETGACLTARYDLVVASGSLQYADDWRELLAQLAAATSGRLFVTRLPVVGGVPSYALRQRAHAYGYATDYVGWVLNRDELRAGVEAAGAEVEREFVLTAPMPVDGLPERPVQIGLLLRPREPR